MGPLKDDAARLALKQRLGPGARYDASRAPAHDLLMARRVSALLARKVADLSDVDLFAPSLVAGLNRARILVHVSYQSRYQALALEALVGGTADVDMADVYRQFPDVETAATLPARALRHLFDHSRQHLNICWRDLSDADWDRAIAPRQFGSDNRLDTPVRSLPGLWASEMLGAAIALGNGAYARDVPQVVPRPFKP